MECFCHLVLIIPMMPLTSWTGLYLYSTCILQWNLDFTILDLTISSILRWPFDKSIVKCMKKYLNLTIFDTTISLILWCKYVLPRGNLTSIQQYIILVLLCVLFTKGDSLISQIVNNYLDFMILFSSPEAYRKIQVPLYLVYARINVLLVRKKVVNDNINNVIWIIWMHRKGFKK